MKRIRKYLAGLLCTVCLLAAFPSGAYAASNNVEPAGFVSQVNSVFMVPQLGGTMPTTAVNAPNTIVTAEWSPSGLIEVDKEYNFKLRLVLGSASNNPEFYVYAREGTVDIALQFPSGHTRSLVSQTFAENPGIAWQIDYNYVSHPGQWVWGTINYENNVPFTPYHSINYNADGGRIVGSGYPTYAEDGGNVPMSSLPQAEKEGYVFGGWKYDESKYSGLLPLGSVEQSLSAMYGAIYLKAIWTEAPQSYSLSFDPNGGSGSMGSMTVTEGQSTRLPNNSFTREGYYFTGWNTRADGNGTSYSDGAYATFYGNTTLYAQWQKYADHVVTFYKNDGSGESRSQTIAYGQSGKLEANSFTREGYSFTSWNTKADGSGTSYGDGETVTPGGNMELYAQWNAESYTLSFDANGGNGEMAAESVTYGVATRLPENAFTREKYSFTGWNTKADGSGTSYGDRETVSFTEDTVLYAQWELVPSYVVLIPDGDDIAIDPVTRIGTAQIGIETGSVIPEDRRLRLSVNAGKHYEGGYRMMTEAGDCTGYALSYKGSEVDPGGSGKTAVLEEVSSDEVYRGFLREVRAAADPAKAAGRYTDLLTFSFAIV